MHFIGLDVHKKTISDCVKDAAGRVYQEGKIRSTRWELDELIRTVLHRMRGPSAVRHSCAILYPDQRNARSPERAQGPRVFFLTLTYMEVGKPSLYGGLGEFLQKSGMGVSRPSELLPSCS